MALRRWFDESQLVAARALLLPRARRYARRDAPSVVQSRSGGDRRQPRTRTLRTPGPLCAWPARRLGPSGHARGRFTERRSAHPRRARRTDARRRHGDAAVKPWPSAAADFEEVEPSEVGPFLAGSTNEIELRIELPTGWFHVLVLDDLDRPLTGVELHARGFVDARPADRLWDVARRSRPLTRADGRPSRWSPGAVGAC